MEQPFIDCCGAGSLVDRRTPGCFAVNSDIQLSVVNILVAEYAKPRDDVTEWYYK